MLIIDKLRSFTMTRTWNLFLLTLSALLSSFVLCSIAKPHAFVSGGIYGLAMLITYLFETDGIGVWYALFNIPLLLVGWFILSRRFMLYTIYCITLTALATEFIPWQNAGIEDKMLAAVAVGIGCGVGASLALRSLGSDGGLNIIGLIMYSKYNFSVGSISIFFNAFLFLAATPVISIDNVLYSMIIAFLTGTTMNYFMGVFDKRKMVLVISEEYEAISQRILRNMGRGCTLLHAQGAYSKQAKEIVLTVVHDMQLKRLEELIYTIDPDALIIVQQTHIVLGKGFSQRKVY